MKLFNSIDALSTLILDTYFETKEKRDNIINVYESLEKNTRIKDVDCAFRWLLWNHLPRKASDKIIGLSLDDSLYVGGYWDINRDCINTLLKKALPTITIIKLRASK